eukprot:6305699-Prymnesium_polylepis.3
MQHGSALGVAAVSASPSSTSRLSSDALSTSGTQAPLINSCFPPAARMEARRADLYQILQHRMICMNGYFMRSACTCTWSLLAILPDTQEGAVPHRDRPPRTPWSVGVRVRVHHARVQ